MSLSLLILAAGMGSRYGSLKQLDQMGPSGETVMDYSVFDAMRAGFDRVIFVIRRDFEEEFKNVIGKRYDGKVKIEYAFQDINDLPGNFKCPEGRVKPWGTGHAILSAADAIKEGTMIDAGSTLPAACRMASKPVGNSCKHEPFTAMRIHISSVAMPRCGLTASSARIASSPNGVAALPMPSIFAEKHSAIAPDAFPARGNSQPMTPPRDRDSVSISPARRATPITPMNSR